MGVVIFFLILIAAAGGGYAGYLLSLRFIDRGLKNDNEMLRREIQYHESEIERLKVAINFWASHSSGVVNFNQQVVQNHNQNVGSTISMVVQILQSLQQSPDSNLSQDERQRVEEIIQQARSISGVIG